MIRRSRYQINNALRIPFELKDAFLAKKLKKPLYSSTIELVCQGKRHKIQLRFPGRITLLNHGSKAGEELLMKLGGEKPACIRFLEEWKKNPYAVSSPRPSVRKLKLARNDLNSKRVTLKASTPEDYLGTTLRSRLDNRVVSLLTDLRERVDKQFLSQAEKERRHRYSYSHYAPRKDTRAIIPTIKFIKYEDRLNNPKTKKEEVTKDENNY